jgi:arylsulfatase A-like enzyme
VAVIALAGLPSCTERAAQGGSTDAGERAPRRSPNVLLIVSDDQRAAGTMRVMERTRRWFARGGTRFTNAFATTPLCCPSRATILTGRYAHNHGVLTNDDAYELERDTVLSRYLSEAGYDTALVGKFLNGWQYDEDPPPHFDRWVAFHGGYRHRIFAFQGRERRVRRYTTDVIQAQSLRMLQRFERNDRRPWMLYVAPAPPHSPYQPEPTYQSAPVPRWKRSPAARERDRSDKPPFVRREHAQPSKMRALRAAQLRTLMSLDDLVDAVMRRMRALGEERRTLAIYMSDNGYSWGEHGFALKRLPYTQSVRVPLYVRWPGHVERGEVDHRLVGAVDIAPTILDAAGLSPRLEHPLDGTSLLRGEHRKRLLIEHWTQAGQSVPDWLSLRSAATQYIEYYDSGALRTFSELYDLRRDPWQLRNLLHEDPSSQTEEELAAELGRAARCVGRACP